MLSLCLLAWRFSSVSVFIYLTMCPVLQLSHLLVPHFVPVFHNKHPKKTFQISFDLYGKKKKILLLFWFGFFSLPFSCLPFIQVVVLEVMSPDLCWDEAEGVRWVAMGKPFSVLVRSWTQWVIFPPSMRTEDKFLRLLREGERESERERIAILFKMSWNYSGVTSCLVFTHFTWQAPAVLFLGYLSA